MSLDGAGDVNVFFSSPRVGFGEPPPTTTTTSLLTFADMVLALDYKNISEDGNIQSSIGDIKTESDHTYASSRSSRTTRSQSAKAAALLTGHFIEEVGKLKADNDDTSNAHESPASPLCSPDASGDRYTTLDKVTQHLKGKRSSSVENIHNAESHFPVSSNRACEWPQQVLPKNSPRKSCSFEEVSCDSSKSCIKSSKSSENVHRTGVSHTLHRFVNNTLEFPCWPRKADHTYATATWDGTAASHSLFEQELHQDSIRPNMIEDQEMEEIDYDFSTQTSCIMQTQSGSLSVSPFQMYPNISPLSSLQKDDHTYVKSKSTTTNNCGSVETEEIKLDTPGKQAFSSATFPRQKMREDHTYFHSGLSRKSSGGAVGREWASTQTMASTLIPQDIQIEEAYRNLHSFSHSASAKKDHNYSTSA